MDIILKEKLYDCCIYFFWSRSPKIIKTNRTIKIYKNILYGYDSVAKLTKTEWKAAPYVVLANQLVCTIWFSQKEQYQELYEINKKMTWWIIEHFDQLRFEED